MFVLSPGMQLRQLRSPSMVQSRLQVPSEARLKWIGHDLQVPSAYSLGVPAYWTVGSLQLEPGSTTQLPLWAKYFSSQTRQPLSSHRVQLSYTSIHLVQLRVRLYQKYSSLQLSTNLTSSSSSSSSWEDPSLGPGFSSLVTHPHWSFPF